jgi:hypothetical protein
MAAPEVSRQWLKEYVQNRRAWWASHGIAGWVRGETVHLVRFTRPGYPLESAEVDVFWCNREQAAALVEGEAMTMLRKREERKVLGEETTGLRDPEWSVNYPSLWEQLTATRYPDGSAREPGSLLLFVQDGQIKAMLRDKDQGLCLWATAKGASQVLSLLETMVSDEDTDWREDRQAPGQQARRKRR